MLDDVLPIIDVVQVVFKSIIPRNEMATLEASLGGIITTPGYEDISLTAHYVMPRFGEPGTLDATLR